MYRCIYIYILCMISRSVLHRSLEVSGAALRKLQWVPLVPFMKIAVELEIHPIISIHIPSLLVVQSISLLSPS